MNAMQALSLGQRVVNFLRTKPSGYWLTTPEVTEWLYLPDDYLAEEAMKAAQEHGLVRLCVVDNQPAWSLA